MDDIRTWLLNQSEEGRRYWIEWLPTLAADGIEPEGLFNLLTNFDFINIKITELNIQAAINDYNLLSRPGIFEYNPDKVAALRLIQKALQQSANILEADNTQLPSQLLARLFPLKNPVLKKLLQGEGDTKGAKDCELYPWVEPLTVTFSGIDQPFQKSIATYHDGAVDLITISGDGNWMLSARKNQVKLWNVTTDENKHLFNISEVQEREEGSERNAERTLTANVSALALSFDGRWAAVAFDAYSKKTHNFIEVWDAQEGERLTSFQAARDGLTRALAISESGQHILIGFDDGLFIVWMLNEERSHTIGMASLRDALFMGLSLSGSSAAALSPNGRWAVTTSDRFLVLWDLVRGQLVRSFRITAKSPIKALALSREGIITAVFADGTLHVWHISIPVNADNISIEEGMAELEQRWDIQIADSRNFREVLCTLIALLRQSPSILSLLSRFSRLFWARKLISGLILQVQKPLLYIYRLLIREDENYFVGHNIRPSDLSFLWILIQLFSTDKPQEITSLNLKGLNPPDSITADGRIGLAKTQTDDVQLIDLATARSSPAKPITSSTTNRTQFSTIHEPWGRAAAISLDGHWIFSLAKGDTLQMWDTTTRTPYMLLKRKKLSSFWQRLTSKKTYPLFTSVREGRKICTFFYNLLHQDLLVKDIDMVAKSLNGRWLFLISKNSFDVRDLAQTTSQHGISRWCLRDVSPNGQWGLWQSSTRTLRVTNLKTGDLAGILHDYYGDLADPDRWRSYLKKDKNGWKQDDWKYEIQIGNATSISADGDTVLLYENDSFDALIWELFHYLVRWNVQQGNISKVLSDYQVPKFQLQFGQESPHKKWIVSTTALILLADSKKGLFGLEWGGLKLCDLRTHQEIYSLAGHTMKVTAIALSPDECWAVSCSLDQTIKIWHLPSRQQVASFTSDSPLHTCRITKTEAEQLFIIAGDADKRTHVLQFRLPENFDFLPEEDNTVVSIPQLETLEEREQGLSLEDFYAGKPVSEDVFIPDRAWQRTIGIPLPLYRLKTLPDELDSEAEIDYRHLLELLRSGQWRDAEEETEKIFLKVLGKENSKQEIKPEDIRNFPCIDLLTMDRLWLKYSEGRYGFSIQMRIWEKFHHDYVYFLKVMGRDSCDVLTIIPCESMQERRGYFPYISFLNDHLLARQFFPRLAECSGYPHISYPLDETEMAARAAQSAFSPRPNYEVGIVESPPLDISSSEATNLESIKTVSTYTSSEEFYEHLHTLLGAQHWEEASIKTFQRLLAIDLADREELQTIDDIWLEQSNQRFGFSIQKRIWEEVDRNLEAFCHRLGWIMIYNTPHAIERINFSSSAPEGHLPAVVSNDTDCINHFPNFLQEIFSCFDTLFPATVPYKVQLKGLPGQWAYLKVQVKGTGILDLRLYVNNRSFLSKQWVCQENKIYDFDFVPISLPSNVSGQDLKGSLIFKSLSGKTLSSPFVSFTISCSLNSDNDKELIRLRKLNQEGSELYQLLELQKHLLGEYHLDIELTLEKLARKYEEIGCYAEAEVLKYQKQQIQQSRHKIEIGDESSAIILLLSPDEIVS